MNYESFMEVVKKRRTTRVYRPDPIPDEFIDKVIEAAHWAPTGANTQPFEFVVVKDKKNKQEIKRIYSETFVKTRKVSGPSAGSSGIFMEAAPVLVLVLGDPRFREAYPKGEYRDEIFHASLSAAVQNMHLAATALGLGGSVWLSLGPVAGVKIKEFLNIPQVFILKTILPLGIPKVKHLKAPIRRTPVIHNEYYDRDKFMSDEKIQEVIEKTAIFKGNLSCRRKL
jgi:nitroreductase